MSSDVISSEERKQSYDSVSLRDYLETKLDAEVKRLDEVSKLTNGAVAQATTIANSAMDKRLEGMNEFRQQMTDQTKTFITKEEYAARHDALEKRISGLEKVVWGAVGAMVFVEAVSKLWTTH